MMFMNEYEISEAIYRFEDTDTPNLLTAAQTVARLCDWTNCNSDGWAYWPKPCRAAAKLQALLNNADRFDPEDVTDAQLAAALRPVKAFLTRQGVDHAAVLV